jgi:hypothetical protein
MSDSEWRYRDAPPPRELSVVGYDVIARDGLAGRVSMTANSAGRQWLIIESGFWVFAKKHLIFADGVTRIDHDENTVTVEMTRNQIKAAPSHEKDGGSYDGRNLGPSDRPDTDVAV